MQDSRWPYLAAIPNAAPRAHGRFARAFGRLLLRLAGWRIEGEFPDLEKLVIVAAPHTSGWDGFWGLVGKLALGLDIRIIAKAELFRWPLNRPLRWLGVRPVNRARARGVVEGAVALLSEPGPCWYLLAPEGTRKPVPVWKSGFWRIARTAGAPVMCAAFDYPNRRICVGPTIRLSDDFDADMARFATLYAPYSGRHPQPGGWRELGATRAVSSPAETGRDSNAGQVAG